MENKILFKHSSYSTDLIYALAGIKAICEPSGTKAIIYQWIDQPGMVYDNTEHPYGNSMMNRYAFDMIKPLIEAQPYVESFVEWNGENTNIDFDKLRQVKSHMPYGNIVTWPAMVFAEMMPRYWESWIHTNFSDTIKSLGGKASDVLFDNRGKILINRTNRYRGQWIDYFHLKKYEGQLMFTGTKDEYEEFKHDWGIDLPLLEVGNFYELAVAISACKLFIGNQSMCFAIAEAMKVPRLLEVCDFAPNVTPAGQGGHYFRVPEVFAYLVDKLMK